ncbi:hypothetical protein BKA67DRAFT_573066 [Truncatella angustata]|uniref:Uncharacterized protein n=1 Tax=Truncatella angustata TaxID=152316 RepID=A0A9P8UGW3_9PEZI|nr:uncharacterized protein BKA67DRAFT_573066 [Truncatella angustata]KAH6652117.1 hypothetical protein BKA67DRAFT_573066 [Truncatella angustata]
MTNDTDKDQALATSDNAEALLVYSSSEQFNHEQKRRKRPSVVLGALCVLFLSSGSGIALAMLLVLDPVEVQGACLSRDFILQAALLSLLYIALHIRVALRDYTRTQPGPPHMHRNYLHTTALLVARLSISVWACALIATSVMISRALPLEGLASKVPVLNLLLCIGAL